MMTRIILSFILASFFLSDVSAQVYEEIVIDLSERDRDYGTVIQPYLNGYIIGTRDDCPSRRCSGLARFNKENELLWYLKRDSVVQQRETLVILDSAIYYTGFNEFDPSFHVLELFDHSGYLDTTFILSESNIDGVTISASTIFGSYHISGSIVELKGDTMQSYAGMFWFNVMTQELDTVIITDIANIDVWDFRVTPDTSLLVSFYYNVLGGTNDWHRRIEKYNREKELVWVWDKGGLDSRDIGNRSSLEVLDSGDIIIEHTHGNPISSSASIWCLDSEGEKKWQYDMADVLTGGEFVYNVRKTESNDIIACGTREDVLATDTRSGLVCKISSEGELLWKRTYADTLGPFDLVGGELLDIVELEDGSLVATGFKNTRYTDADGDTQRDRDLWILHMDENGCLDDRCGVDLTSSKELEPSPSIMLYPDPASDILCTSIPLTGRVSIYSMQGELVYEQDLQYEDCVDVSQMVPGTYVLRYVSKVGRDVFTDKFVKL